MPAYQQIESHEIKRLFENLPDYDVVVARRWPRIDPLFNRLQAWVFHFILNIGSECKWHDIGCGVRLLKKKVAEEVKIYADQHRFLPILAHKYGFKVAEVNVKQSDKDIHKRIYPPGVYTRRLLDILSIFFLVQFIKKPLRFFGIIGSLLFVLGSFICFYLLMIRLILNQAIAGRPLLLLGVLLLVLGIQILAIGLIGEIIIFTHAKDMKEYNVEEIIN